MPAVGVSRLEDSFVVVSFCLSLDVLGDEMWFVLLLFSSSGQANGIMDRSIPSSSYSVKVSTGGEQISFLVLETVTRTLFLLVRPSLIECGIFS